MYVRNCMTPATEQQASLGALHADTHPSISIELLSKALKAHGDVPEGFSKNNSTRNAQYYLCSTAVSGRQMIKTRSQRHTLML